jgi:putative endonuclease
MWYLYVLICNDDSLYCGITTDPERRLKQHNGELKGGSKYTRSRRPCHFILTKKAMNRSTALKEEYQFKRLNRIKKINYIIQAHQLEELDQLARLLHLQ